MSLHSRNLLLVESSISEDRLIQQRARIRPIASPEGACCVERLLDPLPFCWNASWPGCTSCAAAPTDALAGEPRRLQGGLTIGEGGSASRRPFHPQKKGSSRTLGKSELTVREAGKLAVAKHTLHLSLLSPCILLILPRSGQAMTSLPAVHLPTTPSD